MYLKNPRKFFRKIAARFVGGCVRKYLTNENIDDIDVATILSTKEIKEKFKIQISRLSKQELNMEQLH